MKSIQYAQQKLKAVLATLRSVQEMDFPYADPQAAIEYIRNEFEKDLEYLDDNKDPSTTRKICETVSKRIDDFLLAIGFMIRACDVDGALELQGPLRRLTHRALNPKVQLVISSEWRYSPFTWIYPEEFGEFADNFVLIGLPAPEAGNPLIAPLAGHELGHNVWNRLPLAESVAGKIEEKVISTIKGDRWEEYAQLGMRKEQLDETTKPQSVVIARNWGVLQAEEMFCDFFALCIFGEGYLHAFQYLIAPGGGLRNPIYPGMKDRIAALLKAAVEYGITSPPNFAAEFEDSKPSKESIQELLLFASDAASRHLVDYLIQLAKSHCENRGLIARDQDEVEQIVACYRDVIPATRASGLASIINAAWRIALGPDNPWAEKYPVTEKDPDRRAELIRDLALKSFEVFEIERVQERPDAAVSR